MDGDKKTSFRSILMLIPLTAIAAGFILQYETSFLTSDSAVIVAQTCNPRTQTCCEYEGRFYPVGTQRGPYVCRADGQWRRTN